jgi:hypothetical protein
MLHFQTQKSDLGKFWRVLQWKMLVYFMAIWSILRSLGIFCGPLVFFWSFGIFLPRFGRLGQEKSCNPAAEASSLKN